MNKKTGKDEMENQKRRWNRLLRYFMIFPVFLYGQTLSLQECLELAYRNNPDLVKSRYAVETAKISIRQALSSLLPGVSASASSSTSGPWVSEYDPEWGWSIGGGISYTLYRPGLYSNIPLFVKRKKSAEYTYRALQDQIRVLVERYYYQILTSDTLIGVYKANIRLAEEQIRKMRLMVNLGLKRESDLLKSEVQRGSFEAQLVRELENRNTAVRRLNVLMGRNPEAPLALVFMAVDTIVVPDLENALESMWKNNPELQRVLAQIEIQKLSLQIAREAYLPSISGNYSYNRSGRMYDGGIMESDQIGIRLSLNIFDGFSRYLDVQREKVGLKETQLDYETTLRELEEALVNQYNALETQNRLVQIHKTNLASAQKDLEVVTRQYAEGFSTILDLMDAQVSVLQSQTNLLQDLYTRKLIESEIRRLMGKEE